MCAILTLIKLKPSMITFTASLAYLKQNNSLMVSPFQSMPSLFIDACGVLSQLRRLNFNKAHGPDELSPQLLKLDAEELAPAFTILFQQSYDLSSTPKDWNSAIVTPIYKKGLRYDPSNYRPISHACICCKIMEHIMLSHIAKHIAKNNIIINEQHGFRNKLSTITQLINTTTDWASTLDNKGQTDIIFLDFSKAFDKISHNLSYPSFTTLVLEITHLVG